MLNTFFYSHEPQPGIPLIGEKNKYLQRSHNNVRLIHISVLICIFVILRISQKLREINTTGFLTF